MNRIKSNDHIPFSRPEIGEEEIAEVVATLRGGWITTGPRAVAFEQAFAEYIGGGSEAIAVNSATAGLHLALEGLGIGPGDEVITTTNTFTATAEVVRYLGADPVIVDIRPDTLNIDPACIEAALTPRTRAVIPVHFGGLACDMDAIFSIAGKHGLKIVEDAAHALPSSYAGVRIGALRSDATVFSFYANKTITTGEGGMIVTRNRDLAARCRIMRLHGISRDVFDRYRSTLPSWHYDVVAPGFKYNLTDIAAAIGIHQLRKADLFQAARQRLAERYLEQFDGLPVELPVAGGAGNLHAWHLFVIRLSSAAKIDRDSFIDQLAARGIGTSVHFIPLHLHSYWKKRYALNTEAFPVATHCYRGSVSLPLFPGMSDAEQERVIAAVRELLE
ncbi:MAG: DegT/DnrJ/EryC1/StrS aminotransferase family protein [Gammaproteobacteria bacterium]|nr:DegT/DnrJ/EryC1/StrS aminotransferase family protein [Gammaproteobacteria bacterium]HXK55434.1 DegT/DnrJ/EryC1/StrS aminotransferase family protein [Gammaproteobacteria bacterium]